ncbi:hypothetical protein CDAR_191021 [Caerostris darwini]|uniref:Uncharacterized protein n=1 Tax=Caerostris darwini TaxID=1538125 RepID=A0AAV4VBV6_9ARAC|nr:hypothetical protein CDAR_191021 [Caerostris darwini]
MFAVCGDIFVEFCLRATSYSTTDVAPGVSVRYDPHHEWDKRLRHESRHGRAAWIKGSPQNEEFRSVYLPTVAEIVLAFCLGYSRQDLIN